MEDRATESQRCLVTVVIATLGGPSLKGTICSLNRGSVTPDEILVCIPEKEARKAEDLTSKNVKVIVTECRGQVAQRVIGFRNASHDFVMQLDDDMLLDEFCLENLVETLKECGSKTAVAPALMNLATGESAYKKPGKNDILQCIYYWFMNGGNGYRPGQVDLAGSGVGVDPAQSEKELFDVEWLAGGCVMHLRKNLILENYYPFTGKAYFEDIVHSYRLRQNGINLVVDSKALCWLEPAPSSNFGLLEFLKYLVSDYRDRKYAVRLYSRSLFRMHLYYLIRYLSHLYKKLKGAA